MTRRQHRLAITAVAALLALSPKSALAWGDEGHEIIGLIAERFLHPAVRAQVAAILAADPDNLTAHDIASEATWADKHKVSEGSGAGEACRTCGWHFVNVEIDRPDLDQACFGHPALPAGVPASRGPARQCIGDKIAQFAAELSDPATDPGERLLALKFLLHLVGDLHQPLHVADDHDEGGNRKPAAMAGVPDGNLHFFWDVPLVAKLGADACTVAKNLIEHISARRRRSWSQGTVTDWTWETFRLGRDHAYGLLPKPTAQGVYFLPRPYVQTAVHDTALQLSKAGVRLAVVLDRILGRRRLHPSGPVLPASLCRYGGGLPGGRMAGRR